jgi:hypothetical protein
MRGGSWKTEEGETEDRRPKSEVGRWKTEDRRRKVEGGRQKSEAEVGRPETGEGRKKNVKIIEGHPGK